MVREGKTASTETEAGQTINETQDQPSFNLWTMPWIDLVTARGTPVRTSVCDALGQAESYGPLPVSSASPLLAAGQLRFLIAVTQAVVQPRRVDDIVRHLERGMFDARQLATFAEQHAAGFEMQRWWRAAGLQKRKAGAGHIALHVPSGSNTVLFRKVADAEYCVCPACLAQLHLTLSAFAPPAGRGTDSTYTTASINGRPPVYVLPVGQNLFESLSFALMVDPPGADDPPLWLRAPVAAGGETRSGPVGYLHGLTWQPRRLNVKFETGRGPCAQCGQASDWLAVELGLGQGESPRQAGWQDPFVAQLNRKNGESYPFALSADGALWPHLGRLFSPAPAREGQTAPSWRRPAIVEQAAKACWPTPVRWWCVSVSTFQARIDHVTSELWPASGTLLADPQLSAEIEGALELFRRSEALVSSVLAGAWGKSQWTAMAAGRMRLNLRADSQQALKAFLGRLEAAPAEARAVWAETVTRQAHRRFQDAIRSERQPLAAAADVKLHAVLQSYKDKYLDVEPERAFTQSKSRDRRPQPGRQARAAR